MIRAQRRRERPRPSSASKWRNPLASPRRDGAGTARRRLRPSRRRGDSAARSSWSTRERVMAAAAAPWCAPSRGRARRRAGGAPLRALGLIFTAALVASILPAPKAHARFPRVTQVVRATCRDGVVRGAVTEPGCDWDLACNDTCTFAFFCVDACEVDPPPGSPTLGGQFAVPVGEKKIIKRGQLPSINITKFVLRCRRHPRGVPCPTTTTTEPTASTTSTTMPPLSTCRTNADCRVAGNPCMPGFCGGGLCQPTCACIAPDFTAACSPEQAIHCPNPDCHPVVGDPCRHCDESGLCVTIPLCV